VNVADFEDHFHQRHVLVIHLRWDLSFHRLFRHVIHRQTELHSGQRPGPRWIAFRHREGVEFGALRIWRAENYDEIFALVLFGRAFDFILTFQVKGARRGSNETVRHLRHDLGSRTRRTLGDCCSLNTIPLTQRQYFLAR
jgi:hypothetical protein